jgi:hypothetical protein
MEELLKNCEDKDYSFNYIIFNPDNDTYNNFINDIPNNSIDVPYIKYNNIESIYIYNGIEGCNKGDKIYPIYASRSNIINSDKLGKLRNSDDIMKLYEKKDWLIIISKDYIRFQWMGQINKNIIMNHII